VTVQVPVAGTASATKAFAFGAAFLAIDVAVLAFAGDILVRDAEPFLRDFAIAFPFFPAVLRR
jgi:hypothetical protein